MARYLSRGFCVFHEVPAASLPKLARLERKTTGGEGPKRREEKETDKREGRDLRSGRLFPRDHLDCL